MHLLRLALVTTLIALPALAQSNTFDLQSGGKSIGRSVYTLAKAKQGYKLSTRLGYHLNGAEYDLSDDFKLSDTYTFLEGSASNISSQMHTSYVPNKPRTDLVIAMVQANAQDSHHLAVKPEFTILPAYDAGAAQAMLLLATTHPSADNLYNVVVPGNPGASAPPPPDAAEASPAGRSLGGNNAYDALWTSGPEGTGTLDGKPVALHTYILTAGKSTWTFFADAANTLMQLDNSMARVSYVRAKFKLNVVP